MLVTETEGVALISVVGTITSGFLGSRVTYWAGQRSIDSSTQVANGQRYHESQECDLDRQSAVKLADRNREQERRLNGYIAIQSMVHARSDRDRVTPRSNVLRNAEALC